MAKQLLNRRGQYLRGLGTKAISPCCWTDWQSDWQWIEDYSMAIGLFQRSVRTEAGCFGISDQTLIWCWICLQHLINLDHLDKTTAFLNVITTNYDEPSFSNDMWTALLFDQPVHSRALKISFPNKTKCGYYHRHGCFEPIPFGRFLHRCNINVLWLNTNFMLWSQSCLNWDSYRAINVRFWLRHM